MNYCFQNQYFRTIWFGAGHCETNPRLRPGLVQIDCSWCYGVSGRSHGFADVHIHLER